MKIEGENNLLSYLYFTIGSLCQCCQWTKNAIYPHLLKFSNSYIFGKVD
jgi:hypothetical protein